MALAETERYRGIKPIRETPPKPFAEESVYALPQPLRLMTGDEAFKLQRAFEALPLIPVNANGAYEMPLGLLSTLAAPQHTTAELFVREIGPNLDQDQEPEDLGPWTYRGIKRNSENDSWDAIFSNEESEEPIRHDIRSIELKGLAQESEAPVPTGTSVYFSAEKGKSEALEEFFSGEPIAGNFEGKHIISLGQFERADLETVFGYSPMMKNICLRGEPSRILQGLLVASLFFKESSRTRASSEAAALQLGGQIVSILDPKFSSMAKGESLEHTLLTFQAYVDAIIMRHETKGSVGQAAKWLKKVPIINAGDGDGEHPTQAILDLNTIYDQKGTLEGLDGVIAGDLSHGRTVHSLVQGLALYPGNSLTFLSNDALRLPIEYKKRIEDMGVHVREIDKIEDIPKNADFWYWTRSQTERYTEEEKARLGDRQFVVTQSMLDTYAGSQTILMHPLPINSYNPEILREVQNDPRAIYLESEIRNGMYTRMALLGLILGRLDGKRQETRKTLIF